MSKKHKNRNSQKNGSSFAQNNQSKDVEVSTNNDLAVESESELTGGSVVEETVTGSTEIVDAVAVVEEIAKEEKVEENQDIDNIKVADEAEVKVLSNNENENNSEKNEVLDNVLENTETEHIEIQEIKNNENEIKSEKEEDSKEQILEIKEDILTEKVIDSDAEQIEESDKSVADNAVKEIDNNAGGVINNSDNSNSSNDNSETSKTKTKKSKMTKKSKVILTASIIGVFVVLCSIILPILIVNRNKVFIKSVEDFANFEKGNIFVLKNDVTVDGDLVLNNHNSIDLNKHNLTVNGNLTLTADYSNNALNIGTIKSKEFINSGIIQCDVLTINAIDGDINIHTNIQAKKVIINSIKKINLNASMSVAEEMSLTATETIILDSIAFADNAIAKLAGGKFWIKKSFKTNVVAEDCEILTTQEVEFINVELNPNSILNLNGKIEKDIVGGKLVTLNANSSCRNVYNVAELRVDRENALIGDMVNCGIVKFIVQLATPSDIIVTTDKDKVICSVSPVNNASRYQIVIDDVVIEIIEHTDITSVVIFDITAFASTAGEHKINVVAMGKDADDNLYLNSEPIFYKYRHKISLNSPKSLKVFAEENKVFTEFSAVDFADYYKIYIDATVFSVNKSDKTVEKIDISQYISEVGVYSVRVQAYSNNLDITPSRISIISYFKTSNLESPVLNIEKLENGDLKLSWNKVLNSKYFEVYKKDAQNKLTAVAVTGNNSLIISLADIDFTATYVVNALMIGYHNDSAYSNAVSPIA